MHSNRHLHRQRIDVLRRKHLPNRQHDRARPVRGRPKLGAERKQLSIVADRATLAAEYGRELSVRETAERWYYVSF